MINDKATWNLHLLATSQTVTCKFTPTQPDETVSFNCNNSTFVLMPTFQAFCSMISVLFVNQKVCHMQGASPAGRGERKSITESINNLQCLEHTTQWLLVKTKRNKNCHHKLGIISLHLFISAFTIITQNQQEECKNSCLISLINGGGRKKIMTKNNKWSMCFAHQAHLKII